MCRHEAIGTKKFAFLIIIMWFCLAHNFPYKGRIFDAGKYTGIYGIYNILYVIYIILYGKMWVREKLYVIKFLF